MTLRIAAFLSHPIQYFSPLFREVNTRPGASLSAFYFARHGLEATVDRDFGVKFAWDIDLLSGYESEFLPRRWPTVDPAEHHPRALNAGMLGVLRRGWDAVFINGYAHVNNWALLAECAALRIPVLCFGDTTLRTDEARSVARTFAKRAAVRTFFRGVSAFLAAGGQTRQYFAHYGADDSQIFICPYAVDVTRFRLRVAEGQSERAALRERWGVPPGARIVMFCGKLAPWKRPLDMLHAVERLGRSDVVAAFVGDGELRARVEAEKGRRGLLAGFVNQRDIPLALSLADVLVLPSSKEPYGMVVSEAHALGVPAVVSDRCGCHGPESVLIDGVSGFVYPCGDVEQLADRLSRLLGDAALHAKMSAAARERAQTQSVESAADGLLAAVQQVSRGR